MSEQQEQQPSQQSGHLTKTLLGLWAFVVIGIMVGAGIAAAVITYKILLGVTGL